MKRSDAIDQFVSQDPDRARARALRWAEGDSPRLGLARATARLLERELGLERAARAIDKVVEIADEEKAGNRIAKTSDDLPSTSAGTNTPSRDRPEYIHVREFLEEIFRQSPERPTYTNAELVALCREKFGVGVSKRLFKQAKSAALATFRGRADAWKPGGRPTKTVAPQKPSHP